MPAANHLRPGPQPVHYPSMRAHRFHFLDGLRGVAAILIVLYHVPAFLRPGLPMHQAWLAVDFFFLLSGFVIALSYESRLAGTTRFKDFLVARLIRLGPLYLAGTFFGLCSVVVVGALSKHVGISVPDIASSLPFALLLLPNFANHWPIPYCFPFDVPAWSLFLEIAANIVFALMIKARLGQTRTLGLLASLSFLLLVAAVGRGQPNLDLGSSVASLPLGLARAGFSFFAGVLLFRFYRGRAFSMPPSLQKWTFPALSGLALVAILLASSAVTAKAFYQFVVILILFPVVLLLGALSQLPPVVNRVCALLGDISYPLYILHAPFVAPLSGSQSRRFFSLHAAAAPWLLLLFFAFLVVFAWSAARFPDRALRLRLTRAYNAATT